MKILTFSPYGTFTPGAGTFYMLLRYLHSLCVDVTQLHCNGAFSSCERDLNATAGGKPSGVRTVEHCLKCSAEQREQAQFAGAAIHKLTDFLNPEDLQRTRQWVLEREPATLWNESWYGLSISYLIKETFHRMTGESEPRFQSQKHSLTVKRLALVAIRMAIAAQRSVNRSRPNWVWLPSANQEILSKTAYAAVLQNGAGAVGGTGATVARFQTAPDEQMILVHREGDSQPYRLHNVVSTIENVRMDIDTWPREILVEFDEFLGYLGISVSQLGLPVAR